MPLRAAVVFANVADTHTALASIGFRRRTRTALIIVGPVGIRILALTVTLVLELVMHLRVERYDDLAPGRPYSVHGSRVASKPGEQLIRKHCVDSADSYQKRRYILWVCGGRILTSCAVELVSRIHFNPPYPAPPRLHVLKNIARPAIVDAVGERISLDDLIHGAGENCVISRGIHCYVM